MSIEIARPVGTAPVTGTHGRPSRWSALLVCAAAVWMAGCSLWLDFGIDGLSCGDDGRCAEGHVCVTGKTCRAPDGGVCGVGFVSVGGQCIRLYQHQREGSPCSRDVDCVDGLLCLRPLGDAAGEGICARECASADDCDLGTCQTVPSGRDQTVSLCLPPGTRPCGDPGCVGALSCGVFSVGGDASRAAQLCWRPPGSGAAANEECKSSGVCRTGVCVPHLNSMYCLPPCGRSDANCRQIIENSECLDVPVPVERLSDGVARTSYLRVPVCVPGGSTSAVCDAGRKCSAHTPFCLYPRDPTTGASTTEGQCLSPCAERGRACDPTTVCTGHLVVDTGGDLRDRAFCARTFPADAATPCEQGWEAQLVEPSANVFVCRPTVRCVWGATPSVCPTGWECSDTGTCRPASAQ